MHMPTKATILCRGVQAHNAYKCFARHLVGKGVVQLTAGFSPASDAVDTRTLDNKQAVDALMQAPWAGAR